MLKIAKETFDKFPVMIKETAYVRFFGLTKIPLLWYIRPSVIELNDEQCVIKVPLNRRTKNHLDSMYFAVLAAGADLAGGLIAMKHIKNSGRSISLSFKDFSADFFKRAEGDTIFTNNQGREIADFVRKVIESKERMNMPVHITATTPSKLGDEAVGSFTLTLSLKVKD